MPLIRNILKSNQIARDSRHFEGKSILTTFLCRSPYVRHQKLGWEIYDLTSVRLPTTLTQIVTENITVTVTP